MAKLKTLKVQSDNEQGFIVINECDLTDEQKLFSETEVAIEDMKKPQLMAYIKDNDIDVPKELTKMDDIKLHLLESAE